MKLIYKGKYSGSPDDIPHGEHKPGAVMFKEPEMKTLAIAMNIVSFVITMILVVIFVLRADMPAAIDEGNLSAIIQTALGFILSFLILFPHELLHGICFKETVYLYTNLKQGMLFVTGPEDMSKARFVFMSLLPNLVFGLIPFIVFLIFPKLILLGALGAIAIGQGAGDYMNVFNALVQMPKGAKTYLYGFHSYWYMPQERKENG